MRLFPLLVLGSCSTPFGQCVGALTGLYDGDKSGTVNSQLDDDGNLTLELVDETGEVFASTSGTVAEDGELTLPATGDTEISGNMDLESCKAVGSWFSGNDEGTWEISL